MVQIEERQLLVHEALNGGIQLEPFLLVGSLPCLGNQLIDTRMVEPRSGEFVGRCTGEELPREPAIRIPAIAADVTSAWKSRSRRFLYSTVSSYRWIIALKPTSLHMACTSSAMCCKGKDRAACKMTVVPWLSLDAG